jgi:hypothetical protein
MRNLFRWILRFGRKPPSSAVDNSIIPVATEADESFLGEANELVISETNTVSQRDMLRSLVGRFGSDETRLIREYAAAENRGEVRRHRNAYGLTPEQYAARLIADARKKGWLEIKS